MCAHYDFFKRLFWFKIPSPGYNNTVPVWRRWRGLFMGIHKNSYSKSFIKLFVCLYNIYIYIGSSFFYLFIYFLRPFYFFLEIVFFPVSTRFPDKMLAFIHRKANMYMYIFIYSYALGWSLFMNNWNLDILPPRCLFVTVGK